MSAAPNNNKLYKHFHKIEMFSAVFININFNSK